VEYIEPSEFEGLLKSWKGGRDISSFVEGRPQMLYWSFCRAGGHCRYLFKEFSFGARFKADYVILNSYSGVWEVMFIEFEPVDGPVFNTNETPSKRLAGAIKQIDDWIEHYEDHEPEIRSELVRWSKEKDLLGYDTSKEAINMSGDRLADPSSYLKESFHILIGRRNKIDTQGHRRKATYSAKHSIDVRSYDMLLDLAKVRYASPEGWLKNWS